MGQMSRATSHCCNHGGKKEANNLYKTRETEKRPHNKKK